MLLLSNRLSHVKLKVVGLCEYHPRSFCLYSAFTCSMPGIRPGKTEIVKIVSADEITTNACSISLLLSACYDTPCRENITHFTFIDSKLHRKRTPNSYLDA